MEYSQNTSNTIKNDDTYELPVGSYSNTSFIRAIYNSLLSNNIDKYSEFDLFTSFCGIIDHDSYKNERFDNANIPIYICAICNIFCLGIRVFVESEISCHEGCILDSPPKTYGVQNAGICLDIILRKTGHYESLNISL